MAVLSLYENFLPPSNDCILVQVCSRGSGSRTNGYHERRDSSLNWRSFDALGACVSRRRRCSTLGIAVIANRILPGRHRPDLIEAERHVLYAAAPERSDFGETSNYPHPVLKPVDVALRR